MSRPAKVDETGHIPSEEELVRQLRGHLRAAEAHREKANFGAAGVATRQAHAVLEQLARQLTPRFERYARASFNNAPGAPIEDAVEEMTTRLCKELQDLTPRTQFFEEQFNLCVKRLIINAIKAVRRENGMLKDGTPALPGGQPVSLNTPVGGRDGENATVLADTIMDPSEPFHVEILGESFSKALFARLPNRTYAAIMQDKLNGYGWDEISHRRGISVATARHHYKKACAVLQEVFSDNDWKEAVQ